MQLLIFLLTGKYMSKTILFIEIYIFLIPKGTFRARLIRLLMGMDGF